MKDDTAPSKAHFHAKKKRTKRICSVEGCNRRVMRGLRFLCKVHYKGNSGTGERLVHHRNRK